MASFFHKVLSTNIGVERLTTFFILLMIIGHVFTCLWILIATYNYDKTMPEGERWSNENNWIFVNDHDVEGHLVLYIQSFYFMVETITTVGYGDYSASNVAENIYLIVIMFAGVISFSYATGSLSSII